MVKKAHTLLCIWCSLCFSTWCPLPSGGTWLYLLCHAVADNNMVSPSSSLLQAGQQQLSQSLLMLCSSPQANLWPLWDSLQCFCASLVVGNLRLDAALQTWSHKCQEHFPGSAGCSLANTAQDVVGLLCCFLESQSAVCVVDISSQISRLCLWFCWTSCGFCQPVQVPLNCSPAIWPIDHSPYYLVCLQTCWECTPSHHQFVNEDIKQYWSQYWSLKDATTYWLLFRSMQSNLLLMVVRMNSASQAQWKWILPHWHFLVNGKLWHCFAQGTQGLPREPGWSC